MKKLLLSVLTMLSASAYAQTGIEQTLPTEEPARSVVKACHDRVDESIIYDPSYKTIMYPMGDIDPQRGVCTDAVIRVLRDIGIDLQKLVHEDIKGNIANKSNNPYGRIKPDKNIDHRRVWTLEKYFKGNSASDKELGTHQWERLDPNRRSFPPGTIIFWNMGGDQGHIGIVVDNEEVFHQVCCGQVIEDALFDWDIVGAYRISAKWWNEKRGK